jgi:hypothetical protein
LDKLRQQALDYSLGILPKEESILFEASLEVDEDARKFLIEAGEDCANLSLVAPPSRLSDELKNRVMENSEPKRDFNLFLESKIINRLRDNYSAPDERYTGGGGSSKLTEIGVAGTEDRLEAIYLDLIALFALVGGNSAAAEGDFGDLKNWIGQSNPLGLVITETLALPLPGEAPPAQSARRSLLAALPSLAFFVDRVGDGSATLADVRRIFYLCRDQLKIMRASFSDLDPARLVDDEELRLHGAGLLRSKWWGAEHAYFSTNGKVRCGHFFDGPVTERCVEFAEYDSNLYCLANLLAKRSGNGEFHLELFKDAIPDGVLAVAMAETSPENHAKVENLTLGVGNNGHAPVNDLALWKLVESSLLRGNHELSAEAIKDVPILGCNRFDNSTYLWFTWPSIPNNQDGAQASTGKPGQ